MERRADRAFGVQRAEEERQELLRLRLEGKRIRLRLKDTIKTYIDRHPNLSENNRKGLYVNASQRITLVVFGRNAKKLAEDLGVIDSLRDALTPDELILLQEGEDTPVRLAELIATLLLLLLDNSIAYLKLRLRALVYTRLRRIFLTFTPHSLINRLYTPSSFNPRRQRFGAYLLPRRKFCQQLPLQIQS